MEYGYIIKQFLKHKKRDNKLIHAEYDTLYRQQTITDPFINFTNNLTLSTQQYQTQFISLMKKYVPIESQIIELGCGDGRILFHLWKNGYRNLTGVDLSENGVSLARKYSAMHNCFEQLKYSLVKIVSEIFMKSPKMMINFEWIKQYADFKSRLYFKSRDYQDNLLDVLKSNKNIKIKTIEQLPITSLLHKGKCFILTEKLKIF